IDRVSPEIDCGRFAVKRIVGDHVTVEADIVCDGHDELECVLHVRQGGSGSWRPIPMECRGNDLWTASFACEKIGLWQYFITARPDTFATWVRDLHRRRQAGEDLRVEFEVGAVMVHQAAHRAPAAVAGEFESLAIGLGRASSPEDASHPRLVELMRLHADRKDETRLDPPRSLWVDREKARRSSWYEVFPRSWGPTGEHGSLRSLADRLHYVADMGFDVLYLTPIHPIGASFRKGRNNALEAAPEDVGSPWAVGSAEGGHTAIHPRLGSLDDFEVLRSRAETLGIEIALDFAVQCSPDHPWVREHPEWFRRRPDGRIAYAENPPKKYQDIVPFDFQCDAWKQLWEALAGVVRFWVDRGVRIFRVDNPHTKPFAFWEWLITEIHRSHPDVLFLAEAFTRPKTMYRLAKLGFTWSYTYFTWRTAKHETGEYLEEVTRPPVSEFFRPSFWPNTPDILHATLQQGGRPMFVTRLVLAALSAGSWGIYGPAMELLECVPREHGSEEYLDSEKYEIKAWRMDAAESLAPLITKLNSIRRSEPSMAGGCPCTVEPTDDDAILAWSRYDSYAGSRVLVVANMDPGTQRSTAIRLDRRRLGLDGHGRLMATDLLTNAQYDWTDGAIVTCSPDHPATAYRLACI
ncbi:MAG: alpha-1,4-glucan--maltose-1-phosphate maltosyltransferase, partial [Planctomycetaceae bacterium]